MLDVAVALLDMRGKLERDRLMRTRAAPARNREPNRLEVEPSPRIGPALHRRARTFGIVINLSCSGRGMSVHQTDKNSVRSAVGTVIADRPPPKSVQAEFPHTAPTLGA